MYMLLSPGISLALAGCRHWGTSYVFLMTRLSLKLMTDSLFILVITMSMGILSCITTGWWGAVSLTIFGQTNWLRLIMITVFWPTWSDKRHGNFYHRATSYRLQFYLGGPFPKTRTWWILVPCCGSDGRRRPWRHVVNVASLEFEKMKLLLLQEWLAESRPYMLTLLILPMRVTGELRDIGLFRYQIHLLWDLVFSH